jgi:hypothetical protein
MTVYGGVRLRSCDSANRMRCTATKDPEDYLDVLDRAARRIWALRHLGIRTIARDERADPSFVRHVLTLCRSNPVYRRKLETGFRRRQPISDLEYFAACAAECTRLA